MLYILINHQTWKIWIMLIIKNKRLKIILNYWSVLFRIRISTAQNCNSNVIKYHELINHEFKYNINWMFMKRQCHQYLLCNNYTLHLLIMNTIYWSLFEESKKMKNNCWIRVIYKGFFFYGLKSNIVIFQVFLFRLIYSSWKL